MESECVGNMMMMIIRNDSFKKSTYEKYKTIDTYTYTFEEPKMSPF